MNVIADYLKSIGKELDVGHATEHTHRPALKTLLEALMPGCTATNEPRHVECGAPDFVITQGNVPVGYVEAKDVGTDLDKVTKSEQVARYVEGLSSLILTDYLEFRWIAGGEVRMKARVATLDKDGKLKPSKHGAEAWTLDGAASVAGRHAGLFSNTRRASARVTTVSNRPMASPSCLSIPVYARLGSSYRLNL